MAATCSVHSWSKFFHYRPQTKFAKVMFLHMSVSHSVHGWGGGLPHCMLGYTPRQGTHPPGAVHAGRYGQQAGGMHPTGMQSCFHVVFGKILPRNRFSPQTQGLVPPPPPPGNHGSATDLHLFQTLRMCSEPILSVCICVTIDVMLTLTVTLTLTQTQTICVSKA